MLGRFRSRRDNQIMGLELLAIALGMCTFEGLLHGKKVVVHSDNTGSEVLRFRARWFCVCEFCLYGVRAAWHVAVVGSCTTGT